MRKLSVREKILLGILVVLLVVSGYLMLFYQPMTDRLTTLEGQVAQVQDDLMADQIRVNQMDRMQKELDELFASNPNPVSMSAYDNRLNVMTELNTILAQAQSYSLNFGTVDTGSDIVRRNISLQFKAGSYDSAKAILQQLHDSSYRCMLDNISISSGSSDAQVTVTATIIFFEYQ
jgi:Tfp pilus assembly protein PilO